ncbi:MAG TPA: universal stress protein [Dongiaceae bacterium]|nr:universal stress protein [Dongiaceae bacterium]
MFEHIVCATDFSDTAEAAWAVACDLARAHQSELTLVHVYAEVPPSPDVTVPTVMQVWEEQRRWVADELERRVVEAERRGVRARAVLKLGTAAHGLLETARQTHADLVVVGTHGRTGLQRVLLGSVAEQVVRTAPCPVLTVKPHADARAQAA